MLIKSAGTLGADRTTDDIGSREAAEIPRRESGSKRRKACIVAFLIFIAATNATSPKGASAFEIVTPVATANDGTLLIERVAAAYGVNVAGVLAVRSHSDLAIKAPIFGRHITGDNWYVFENGNLVASSHKPDPRQPPLHDPYRASYLSEYTYRLVPCETCAPGTSAVSYESQTRDIAHAHGTFIIDIGTAHIISGSETPYKLLWPTRSGELNAVWNDSGSGWFPVKVDGAFVGNIGPFVGRAFYTQANTMIERYRSVSAATASLITSTGLAAAHFELPAAAPDVAARHSMNAQ